MTAPQTNGEQFALATTPQGTEGAASSGYHAMLVGAGILLSRIAGLVRQRVFAFYFGTTEAGDAFTLAARIPNMLQNLLGEGVLSASFIPVYSRLAARGEDEARRELASAVLSLLILTTTLLAALGILFAPQLAHWIAPEWTGEKYALTVQLVRILFPGTALFVLSAWSLGVLNSHGRFFLSYVSPVIWNVAMIATLLVAGGRQDLPALAVWLAWGSVAGALLQFAIQLPVVIRVLGAVRLHATRISAATREVGRQFLPAFATRGVVQISALADAFLASFLVAGAVTVLGYAQLITVLPVSLFGMSVTAAELPRLAGVAGTTDVDAAAEQIGARLGAAARRIAYFVIPSAVALLVLGDVVASVVYQNGRFGAAEARWVWGTLAGGAVGLVAATWGRLWSSAFFALGDTRTPLRYAIIRVSFGLVLGAVASLWLPQRIGIDPKWGVAGLTAASGVAAWVEFVLLRRRLARRIGAIAVSRGALLGMWASALAAAGLAWGTRLTTGGLPVLMQGVVVLAVFGAAYLGLTSWAGLGDVRSLARLVRGRGR